MARQWKNQGQWPDNGRIQTAMKDRITLTANHWGLIAQSVALKMKI